MKPDEVMNSKIPNGRYAEAMGTIQEEVAYVKGIGIMDKIIKKRLRSLCFAFELLQYATKAKMKVLVMSKGDYKFLGEK